MLGPNGRVASVAYRRYHRGRGAYMIRRIALITFLAVAGSAGIFAQRGGGGHGGGGGFHGGGMGGGFRGGGMGGFRGGAMGGGFRGGMAGGFRGNNAFRGNFGFRNRFNQFGFSPFFNNGFWPWWGGWGLWGGWPLWDSSDGGYQPASYGSYGGYPYPENYSAGPAPVIINQNLGSAPAPPPAPTITEYAAPPVQVAQSNEPPLFLLAFQDNVIRAVLAYWVDGATLHYVTLEHEQKQAPLSSVDRALSERLNHERNVTFQLPR